ncbi:SRPBCC family protein [Dactylosporangium roseum]|uniref:SRPBCC family protein n=1 Tax=Dactylosporangium roseum TaxID=47989 RepID=UPI0021B29888|nr:SRPBCC family protein [Dactylosporangium roseum]
MCSRARGPASAAPRDGVSYVALFPNLLVSAHPDYVMTHLLAPVAPGRTEIECNWYFPAAGFTAACAERR